MKLNFATKKRNGKWWTYFRGFRFDNGSINLSIKVEQLEQLLLDIKSGELTLDEYDSIKLNCFDDDKQVSGAKSPKDIKEVSQGDVLTLPESNVPESDIPF